jgi:hypothetical protein
MYRSYNEGSQDIVKIFCEFSSENRIGYTFLSADTLKATVQIKDYFNRKDHVMVRHTRNGIQYESKIEILPADRERYNISIFNGENPDFSGPSSSVTKPYMFVGFLPVSFGSHLDHLKGYTCNGINYEFVNCDDNRNNYLAFFQSNTVGKICWPGGVVKDGWITGATAVASSQNVPDEVFFNSYEIGMGGCGCIERNCYTSVSGIAIGLPFDY